jgi:hypothetical protein
MNFLQLLRFAFLALLASGTIMAEERVFYVSPAGSDRNPGTLQQPFRTIERARDAVREFRTATPDVQSPVVVYLRGGLHRLAAPLILEPRDGGTHDSPVVYTAYRDERPVLSGGRELTDWRPRPLAGREVWVTSLPPELGNPAPALLQLWVGSERRQQARHPNTGYLAIAGIPGDGPQTPWNQGRASLEFHPGDIPDWQDFTGSQAIVMNLWTESHLPVTGVDRDSMLLRFGLRSVYRLDAGNPYYLLNVREALDSPGEWFIDTRRREILYLPLPGEEPERFTAIIPGLAQLLLMNGRPGEGEYVDHLTFRGITFSHTEWRFTDTSSWGMVQRGRGGFGQAAFGLPAAVEGHGVRSSTFERCSFSHAGTYGISLREGCIGNTINECTFNDLGGGGIMIGEPTVPEDPRIRTQGNTIINCEIANVGLLFHSAVGIWVGQSPRNRIIHNHIHDLYYSGISIGWTWGYGPACAGGNRVELNHVHHIGARADGDGPLLSDMGGIYTLGDQPGTVIRRNIFHDIAARVYGGWGIYYDEGSTRIVAEENLVYRTSHGGFHQHYGKENVFRNNIIAFGHDHQAMRDHHEGHTSFAFERNIVYWNDGPMFKWQDEGWNMVFDRNVYWRTDGKDVMTEGMDFRQWQATANDPRSVFADPLFRDVSSDDFGLQPGSPALALGFHPIATERILDRTPLSLESLQSSDTLRVRRFLYNSDGSNMLMAADTLTPERAYLRIDPLVGTGITTFLHCVNPGQNMGYPSKVAPMFHWDAPLADTLARWNVWGRRMSNNLARLVADSIDPAAMVLDRVRLRGMEAFVTFRMNELHDVDKPGSPLLSPFWKEHPQYRVGGYAGWGASALNYALPEVQEYFFSLLSEVCQRYDLDGLELDFMRFPYYFPWKPDSMALYAETMTGFVRRVREMTRRCAAERGRRILLAARVPTSLHGCANVGLDPARWCAEDLVDFLTVAPFLSTVSAIPVGEFKGVCGTTPIYTGMEFTIGSRQMTREEKRAAAALLYATGSDGLSLFNYFVAWDVGLKADIDVLHELSSAETLAGTDKLYTLAIPRYPVPNVSLSSPLPLTLGAGQSATVALRTQEPIRPRMMRLRIEAAEDMSPEEIDVTFNGTALSSGRQSESPMIFPQPVEYSPAPVSRSVEFDVDPALLETVSTLRLTTQRAARIDWIYLAVWH